MVVLKGLQSDKEANDLVSFQMWRIQCQAKILPKIIVQHGILQLMDQS